MVKTTTIHTTTDNAKEEEEEEEEEVCTFCTFPLFIKRRRDDDGDSVKEMRALVPPRVLQTMAHLATKRVGERDG